MKVEKDTDDVFHGARGSHKKNTQLILTIYEKA
jgi:hypothetical protein